MSVRNGSRIEGGVDSPVRAGVPVGGPSPMIARGSGSRVVDVDGREYIDYLCAYGPVLLGHADPRITEAVRDAAARGAVYGTTHREELRLAERIARHLPSMERLRFVSTGTEAVMSAVRVARAWTRREIVVRFAGNYHGHSDEMIFGAGASSNSEAGIESGITRAGASNVVTLPYDDLAAVERCLAARAGEVAAIVVEPVCGNMGLVVPQDGYLHGLRELATRFGSLLVFDEVITGFRLGLGGAQGRYRVTPDLTCIGKALGGGLPIAAFGGREEVMGRLAPRGPVFQGGTFSGNPVCAAAAHALLDRLESQPALYEAMDRLAGRLARGLADRLRQARIEAPVVQLASIVDFMFRPGSPHRTYDEARAADARSYARLYQAMLRRGILLAPSPMEVMFLTAAHSDDDIDATLTAFGEALDEIREGVSASPA